MSRSRSVDLVLLLFLVLAGWRLTYGLEERQDISFHDPSFYLGNGVLLRSQGLPEAEDAPLYSLWYYVLSLTQADRVELYYRNYKLLTLLLPLVLYVLLRVCRVSPWASLAVAWLCMIARFNYPSYVRVYHFAACVVLLSLVVAARMRRLTRATLAAAVGALLASYVRPEMFLAFVLLAAFYLGAAVLELRRRTSGGEVAPLVIFLLVCVVVLLAAGVPVAGERSWVAFREHFALNRVAWEGGDADSWTQAESITAGSFGDVHSVPAAFFRAPGMFLRHVGSNLKALPHNARYLLSLNARPFMPGTLVLPFLGLLLLVTAPCWWKELPARVREHGRLMLFAAAYLAASVASVAVIHPRLHYLVLPAVLVALVLAVLVAPRESGGSPAGWGAAVLAGMVVVALVPVGETAAARPNVATVEFVKGLGISNDVTVLHEGGVAHVYFGANYKSCYPGWKKEPFDALLKARGINMVLVTDRLKAMPAFAEDAQWQAFLEKPGSRGFRQLDSPIAGRALLVSETILPAADTREAAGARSRERRGR
ncbi:MAG: hypothetical protein JXB04_11965 [Kiritimatiellae bacterium]|nr:hypothetical protein [Kiritimatiellia bacterium]